MIPSLDDHATALAFLIAIGRAWGHDHDSASNAAGAVLRTHAAHPYTPTACLDRIFALEDTLTSQPSRIPPPPETRQERLERLRKERRDRLRRLENTA